MTADARDEALARELEQKAACSRSRRPWHREQYPGSPALWCQGCLYAVAAERLRAPSEAPASPVLAFQTWAARRAASRGPMTQDEYQLAQEAFYAAHPGDGPHSALMAPEAPAPQGLSEAAANVALDNGDGGTRPDPDADQRLPSVSVASAPARSPTLEGPAGSFGYCAVCYHPLDTCSYCDGGLRVAMRKVRMHTSHRPGASKELLAGLLESIERIADAALSPAPAVLPAQVDLPEAAATILREHASELYDTAPSPAAQTPERTP